MSEPCPPHDPDNNHPSDCQILENYRTRAREKERLQDSPEKRILYAKAEPVKLLLLDVDGVLTDGSLIYSESGVEAKTFNTQDGLGIRLVQKAGVDVGFITARRSEMVTRRAEELSIKYLFQGVGKKLDSYKEIVRQAELKPYQVCYMGDDWIDLALLTRVGLAACPANSVTEVRERCHFTCSRSGGQGAVRELCDLIVRAKGVHENLLQQFLV